VRDRDICFNTLSGVLALACLVGAAAGTMAGPAPATEPPRYIAKDLRLEVLPPAVEGAQFRLRADLGPPPAAANAESAGLKLTATLNTKAGAAQCPLPGSVFFDGFDRP